MLVYRSTVAAAMLAGALLVGCTDPSQLTDLRKSGPPNITAVMVMSDLETAADPNPAGIGRIIETATYCNTEDDKRPGLVGLPDIRVIQVCPDTVSDPSLADGKAEAVPPAWWARVVFDELLDPSIEELIPQLDGANKPTGITLGSFKNTQPVTLKCNGVDVPYDGYYVPNGNRNSWPLGPSLYIQPLLSTSVPTGTSCAVSVKDKVHNKAGDSVPSAQRDRDYKFKLADMTLRFSNPDPSDGDNGAILQDPDTAIDFFWTAALKGTVVGTVTVSTLDPNQVQIFSGPNLNVSATNADGDPDPAVCNGGGTQVSSALLEANLRGTDALITALVLRMDLGAPPATHKWQPNTTYRIQFGPDAKVTPAQGGPDGTFPADYKLCFHTSAAQM